VDIFSVTQVGEFDVPGAINAGRRGYVFGRVSDYIVTRAGRPAEIPFLSKHSFDSAPQLAANRVLLAGLGFHQQKIIDFFGRNFSMPGTMGSATIASANAGSCRTSPATSFSSSTTRRCFPGSPRKCATPAASSHASDWRQSRSGRWEHVQSAIVIAQHGAPQRQLLDCTLHGADFDHVANVELVLDKDKKTIDEIPTRVCAPEADGQSRDAALANSGPILMPRRGRTCIPATKMMVTSRCCEPRWPRSATAWRGAWTEPVSRR